MARKQTAAQKRAHERARDLEQQAATITHTIATLDEQRAKCLVEATVLRMIARGQGVLL